MSEAELKYTKTDIVKIITDKLIVDLRVRVQEIDTEVARLSRISKDELEQMRQLGEFGPRTPNMESYWYGGDPKQFGTLDVTIQVSHDDLPTDVRARREQVRRLTMEKNALNEHANAIRAAPGQAAITQAMTTNETGKQILALLKKMKLVVNLTGPTVITVP